MKIVQCLLLLLLTHGIIATKTLYMTLVSEVAKPERACIQAMTNQLCFGFNEAQVGMTHRWQDKDRWWFVEYKIICQQNEI